MVWLMMPTDFNGSLVLYKRVIRPYFLKHHGTIDNTLQNIKDSGKYMIKLNKIVILNVCFLFTATKIAASGLKSD